MSKINVLYFGLAFLLSAMSECLAVQWVTGVERRRYLAVAGLSGMHQAVLVMVGWLAFVGESPFAAVGMVTGSMAGALVGIMTAPGRNP